MCPAPGGPTHSLSADPVQQRRVQPGQGRQRRQRHSACLVEHQQPDLSSSSGCLLGGLSVLGAVQAPGGDLCHKLTCVCFCGAAPASKRAVSFTQCVHCTFLHDLHCPPSIQLQQIALCKLYQPTLPSHEDRHACCTAYRCRYCTAASASCGAATADARCRRQAWMALSAASAPGLLRKSGCNPSLSISVPLGVTYLPTVSTRPEPSDSSYTLCPEKGWTGRCSVCGRSCMHAAALSAARPAQPHQHQPTNPRSAPGSAPCHTCACPPALRGSCHAAPLPQSRWRWRCDHSRAPPEGLLGVVEGRREGSAVASACSTV